MRAALVTSYDGPGAVRAGDIREPVPTDDQVLVDVEYAGTSFADVLRTRGEYQHRPPLPFAPGWDVSGVVRTDGHGFVAGDRVAAIAGHGGFAEAVAVPASRVFPLPEDVTFRTGAALPLNHLTAHLALTRRGALRAGETVLVQGAAGGVGTAVCDVARALGGRVVAVVSTPEREEVARQAGAHDVVVAKGFRDAVRDLTDGRGVDLVVDPVGGERFTDSLRSLAPEGRLVVVGFAGGEIPAVRTNRLLLTNTTVMGAATSELWAHHPDLPRQQWDELMQLRRTGRIAPVVGGEFPLDQASAALTAIDERRATGRLLVRVR